MATKTFIVVPDPVNPGNVIVVPDTITLTGGDEIRAEVGDAEMVGIASCSGVDFDPATMSPGHPAIGIVTGKSGGYRVKFDVVYKGGRVLYGTLVIT